MAYQTAYLKANYPIEFMCALMTNDMSNTDKLGVLLNEARALNIEVLPPDVNEGQVHFAPTPEGKAVRFGLAAIKGVGEVAVQSILKARTESGPFKSLADLCERVDTRTVNRKILEALIKCGACDCLGETRATLYAVIDRTLARAASVAADRQRGQSSLFGALEENASTTFEPMARLPEWPHSQLLAAEKELLGFYVTGHPLTPYVPLLEKYALANTTGVAQIANRHATRVGGLITAVQQGISRKSNKPYAMATLEDMAGALTLLLMNDNYDKYRELVVPGKAVMVVGEVNNGDDKPKIFPQEIMPLEEAPRRYTKQVHLRLHTAHLTSEHFESVRQITAAHPGKCPLFLCLMRPTGEIVFIDTHEKFSVAPSLQLQQAVDEKFGEETYYAKVDASLPERSVARWERKNGESS